ncbi:flagellar export protein FliJ [Vibrio pectenicida]|uniref:Flagellar export protein FliJ n=1 Tax=Vibrio pectenicida TaxID=62763 RepID=A0A3R9F9F6_9VIBR|nr:flagellar export protein FliJ [Vibrio pectenicida]RSD31889.1 flagellar export protein FliJ [Vibrio pectenicida]
MQSKHRAIKKFCTLAHKQRDLMCVQLDTLQQQCDQANLRIQQLLELKNQPRPKSSKNVPFHREVLLNQCRVEGVLSKMIDHQQYELQLMYAQHHSLQNTLKQKQLKIIGLESKLDTWQQEHEMALQKNEDVLLEEAINNSIAFKVLAL